MIERAQIINDLLSQTLAADCLDERLWALIVTRSFGHPEPVRAWLRHDEARLLGSLEASMCLARTILPGWRIRLHSGARQRPKACCDRTGCRLGFVYGSDESLAVCAALLKAVLATSQRSSTRGQMVSREQLTRLFGRTQFKCNGQVALWLQRLAERCVSRPRTQ